MMPDQYLDALRRGDKVAEDFQKQLAARLTRKEVSGMGMTGATGTNRPGFHIGDLVGAITTGNLGGIARELMQPLGGDR